MLKNPLCGIEKLKLDWNMIRLGSAVAIADSLSINERLTDLDLSYNTFGREGGLELGRSLLYNRSLKTLNIANNGLDSAACITICAGVIENKTLQKVFLDGNPIGEQGAKAVMVVPMIIGSRLKISTTRCNLTMKDSNCPFDFGHLLREYELKMSNPFDRAQLLLLLHLISFHHTYLFSRIENILSEQHTPNHAGGGGGKGNTAQRTRSPGKRKDSPTIHRSRWIDLGQSSTTERIQYFDENQKKVYESLKRIKAAASNFNQAITLFNDIDKDGSGKRSRCNN